MIPLHTAEASAPHSFVICQQLCQWLEKYCFENSLGTSLKIVSDEPSFYLNVCNLARKLGNLRSANRHMQLYGMKMQSCSKIMQVEVRFLDSSAFLTCSS